MKTAFVFLLLAPASLDLHAETLRILLYDSVGLPMPEARGFAEVVGGMVRELGHEVEVADCRRVDCTGAVSCADFIVRVLENAPRKEGLSRSLALSFLNNECGGYVTVYLSPLSRIASRSGMPLSRLTAYVVLHEMGHLMLGTNRHSPGGMMKANWGPSEARRAAQGALWWTPEEKRRLEQWMARSR